MQEAIKKAMNPKYSRFRSFIVLGLLKTNIGFLPNFETFFQQLLKMHVLCTKAFL